MLDGYRRDYPGVGIKDGGADISTWFNDLLSGLPGPYQFALGAGAMLAYKGYKTVKENKEIKRKHPMSYLLSIERELSARG